MMSVSDDMVAAYASGSDPRGKALALSQASRFFLVKEAGERIVTYMIATA